MDLVVVWVVENGSTSVWWIGIELVFVLRSKWLYFSLRIEIN